MPGCALTQGYAQDCRDGIGGVPNVWFIERANVTSVTEAAGVISTITKATAKRFWKYELTKFTASYKETVTSNVQNGTIFYAQELSIALNKMQANTRNELLLLGKNNLIAVVQDSNGKYWYAGRENGLDLTGGESATGVAAGDRNGYTLTFTAQERELAPEVDDSIIASLETPGI